MEAPRNNPFEIPRNYSLEARTLAVRQLYDARMAEITQNLQRAPADVRFCKTCVLINRWPIQVSGMSVQEYRAHVRGDLEEALELLGHNWDPQHMDPGFQGANIPAARTWFCSIDTRTRCHACGLGFDLVHVFDSSGEDTFPGERKVAADEHRTFCPIREVSGWSTDVAQTYDVGDYWDRFAQATDRGDDIMSLVGEDNFNEFILPRIPLARVTASRIYFNRKALANQVLLKHCPKCLRASSTSLMGKKMHERVCQLTRFDWVPLAEVQPFRTQEGVDGREMVMSSNGSLERRFRIMAPSQKARLERKYQRQLYARLNLDERSLTLLGDDNDSEDVSSDQDDRPTPHRRGPRRPRPHRRPINDNNSDDENDYGPGRGSGLIAPRPIRPVPTLDEYNIWHAAMAPTVSDGRNRRTSQILSGFRMEFQEMLQQSSPIVAGAPAPQAGIRPPVRQSKKNAPPSPPMAPRTRTPPSPPMAPRTRTPPTTGKTATGQSQALPRAGPLRTVAGLTKPKGGGAGNVGGPPGTEVPALRESDRERSIIPDPTPHLQKTYDEMPQAFISSVTATGLLDDPISYFLRVLTLVLLRPAWDAQERRTAEEAAGRGKKGKGGAPAPDNRTTLEMYVDFFKSGDLNTNTGSHAPVDLLEVLSYSDAAIERDDTFFQFLFPLDSIAGHNPLLPCPPGFRDAVASTPGLAPSILIGVRRAMRFWGFQFRGSSGTGRPLWRLAPGFVAANHGWTRRVDHNHQRIIHIIRSLRLGGSDRVARSIYRCMVRAIQNRGFPVRAQTQALWRRHALGPLERDPLASDFPPDANFRTDSESDDGDGGQAGGPGSGSFGGSNDGSGGPGGGGANLLLVAGPGASTPGNQPAPPATQQAGSRMPSGPGASAGSVSSGGNNGGLGGPGSGSSGGSNDGSGGLGGGGANPLLVDGPGASTPGNQPAPPATQQTGSKRPGGPGAPTPRNQSAPPTTQQTGSKRPGGPTDDGTHKRQRQQPAGEAPVDPMVSSLSPNWDLLEQLRNTDRQDQSADHDSDDQGDSYSSSVSTEGFLDPHERDEDFLPKMSPPFPFTPYFRQAAVEYVPPVAAPAPAPVPVRGTQPRAPYGPGQRRQDSLPPATRATGTPPDPKGVGQQGEMSTAQARAQLLRAAPWVLGPATARADRPTDQ